MAWLRRHDPRRRRRLKGFDVAVRSTVGHVRPRQEDAWRVLPRKQVVAVFDGLGGMPAGDAASHAAAEALSKALRDEDPFRALDAAVRATGGATTALVARLKEGILHAVGDCGAWAIQNGAPQQLVPKDRAERHKLTDCLGGMRDPKGHAVPFKVEPGASLLICTDGVDEVVDPADIANALQDADVQRGLDTLMAKVEAGGAPDNATAVLVRAL